MQCNLVQDTLTGYFSSPSFLVNNSTIYLYMGPGAPYPSCAASAALEILGIALKSHLTHRSSSFCIVQPYFMFTISKYAATLFEFQARNQRKHLPGAHDSWIVNFLFKTRIKSKCGMKAPRGHHIQICMNPKYNFLIK